MAVVMVFYVRERQWGWKMPQYFNDSPIETSSDDRYGVAPFAQAIAKSVLSVKKPLGTTIAINGPWGSGKSSVVNLIRSALCERKGRTIKIIDFKCWWYRGEEAIALAFLQELNAALKPALGKKIKDGFPRLGRQLLQAGPVLGAAVSLAATGGWGAIVSSGTVFAKRFFPDQRPLDDLFLKICEALEEQSSKFLVIIDDIDRLSPEEALAVFRLVKSVGRLPNVMYLLVFDRHLADAMVAERYPSEGPHFLEKIIQASFELPPPSQADLNAAVLSAFEEICGSPGDNHMVRFMNLFYDIVAPYITSPRHVVRLTNALSVTWPAVKDEISRADYLAMETLRLYEPALYVSIRENREIATGKRAFADEDRRNEHKFRSFLKDVPEDRHESLKIALQRLFPALENVTYGDGFANQWNSERRICLSKHFDTYFRLSPSDETISAADLKELIDRADDVEFVQRTLRAARERVRKNGKSMVPVVLDELTSHGRQIPKEKVGAFFAAVFAIADEIDLEADGERGFAFANTHIRIHWLIRSVTRDRFSLEEQSALYMEATVEASLDWLVDFTSSSLDDYNPRDGKAIDLSTCLVTEADC